jgi:hypothetical protein
MRHQKIPSPGGAAEVLTAKYTNHTKESPQISESLVWSLLNNVILAAVLGYLLAARDSASLKINL